jgi:Carboxypeptidase regulatory-like domain
MEQTKFNINRLRIASACPADWSKMAGDDRVRNCSACKLNVYNTSELTEGQVQSLVEKREGRLCIRLYKRADGTVITRDCPVGIRAYYRKTARSAGLALSAVLGLFTTAALAQIEPENSDRSDMVMTTAIVKTKINSDKSAVSGRVLDQMGAAIPGLKINLFRGKNILTTVADDKGEFIFRDLPAGTYILKTAAHTGFMNCVVKDIKLDAGEGAQLTIDLRSHEVEMGIMMPDSQIDTTSSTVTSTFPTRVFDKLPH